MTDMTDRIERSPLAVFRAHLASGSLAYQFSPSSGRAVFYPRLAEPRTGARDLEWRIASGYGTVHATTVVHPREGSPYNVALIDCDEGFRLMSRVEGVAPDEVAIGTRVRVRIPGSGDGLPYSFVPAGAEP